VANAIREPSAHGLSPTSTYPDRRNEGASERELGGS